MRVLHLIKTAIGAKWALRQIYELIRLGVEIHVALPPGGPMVGEYNKAGVTEHLLQTDFPINTPWEFPGLATKLRNLVKAINPDIIHSHFVGTTLSMRLIFGRGKTIPRVFQVPGPLHLENKFFRSAELATAGQSDFWIGSCLWTYNHYQKTDTSRGRVFHSYYGTNIEEFSMNKTGKLQNELGLKPGIRVIGMVAFMYAPKRILFQKRGLKGHEDLIDAFKICLSRNTNIVCVFVGGAWNNANEYENKLRQYAYQQCGEHVFFMGTRNDPLELYADFDVAVHPSHSENVGGAVESLLMGIPTVATRVGGLPDLVKDGKTGWLVPPKDPIALAKAIQEALELSHNAQKRAMAGQQLARTLFDVKKTSYEIKSIYSQILRSKSFECNLNNTNKNFTLPNSIRDSA